MTSMMKRLLIAAMMIGAPAAAFGQTAGQLTKTTLCSVLYLVQPGDTLGSISKVAYGTSNYQLLFSRNLGVTIQNPNDLPVGGLLLIPCGQGLEPSFDQVVSANAAAAAAAAEAEADAEAEAEAVVETAPEAEPVVETAAVAPAAQPEPVATPTGGDATGAIAGARMLSANGLPPFSDKSLRGDGMAHELLRAVTTRLGAEDPRVVFIDDRSSHLRDLLLEGSFDIGFPWVRPPCEDAEGLTAISSQDAWFCANFAFSEPIYEIVLGFFVRAEEYADARVTFADFADARICRPAALSTLDLEVRGLGQDGVEIVRPETLAECFQLLLDEEVDAVSGDVFAAEALVGDLGLGDQVEEMSSLSLLQTVHAVAPLSKPGSLEALSALSQGLTDLKLNGEWFRIVARHLVQN
ncbi:MAG: hypothetical protein AAFN79_06280 [Pseudomonadota bacterium]